MIPSIFSQIFFLENGISIPYSYTSFICPIQSPRIYSELLYNRDANKPHYVSQDFLMFLLTFMFKFRRILRHHLLSIYTIVFRCQKRNHYLHSHIQISQVKISLISRMQIFFLFSTYWQFQIWWSRIYYTDHRYYAWLSRLLRCKIV